MARWYQNDHSILEAFMCLVRAVQSEIHLIIVLPGIACRPIRNFIQTSLSIIPFSSLPKSTLTYIPQCLLMIHGPFQPTLAPYKSRGRTLLNTCIKLSPHLLQTTLGFKGFGLVNLAYLNSPCGGDCRIIVHYAPLLTVSVLFDLPETVFSFFMP